jgi:nucleoside-diphosphate-sugar epimerase
MKVLITGGTGYVGFNLTARLCALDEITEVIAYDNLSRHNESVFFCAYSASGEIDSGKS